MNGRQHAAIGVGAAAPLAAALATGAVPGLPPAGGSLAGLGGPGAAALTGLLVVGGALLGALLPDLDTERSTLEAAPGEVLRGMRRRRRWLALLVLATPLLLLSLALQLLNRLLMLLTDHRGVTHSLTALALVAGAAWAGTAWAVGPALTVGLAAGYASHLAADALSPSGIELAAPWSRRRWYLAPRPLRFGAASWRAGCLSGLVLAAGLLAAAWLLTSRQ